MSHGGLRGGTAVVGVAESDLGEVGAGRYSIELAAQAAVRALDDAGLGKNDVDGLFGVLSRHVLPSVDIGEYLGIRPRYTDSTMIGGSSFVSYLHHAAQALIAGACDVALIVYGSTSRSASRQGRASAPVVDGPNYERAYRPRGAMSGYALAAARHMYQYGTTREQLAEVAVAARAWARLNPVAFKRGPLTVEDVLARPMLSSPFTSLDCCLTTDGGGAAVMVRAERARDLRERPVYLLGAGEAHWHSSISQMPDLTVSATRDSAARAFTMAGLRPADIDVVELYDAFTINTIMFLEDLGFCAKGEGGAFVSDGRIAPGGELPVNTNGGGLSYCHPGMYGIFTIIEAVRQIRGEAGVRQQSDVHTAVAHGNGGQLSAQATVILGDQAAL
ncbi:acetyl-CoA acetyltransferase [Frankia gtarii]|uniref:acetyl-CoA acetyltransferase n=1 Tax=Frankia gtarii TaxID=2950102 RepID=UPI0021BFBDFF|nr:acetyl-CoA acetyltransferase [Frankia gtarii]